MPAYIVGIDAKLKNERIKVNDMSQENKIDFTKSPTDFFFECCDEHCNRIGPGEAFYSLTCYDPIDSDRVVLFIVIIAYMRINMTSVDNGLIIPENASLDTLSYNEEHNFFIELFNKFKIICEANEVLNDIANTLEESFMAGTAKAIEVISGFNKAYTGKIEEELLEVDWSDNAFGKRDCSLFIRDELFWTNFVDSSESENFNHIRVNSFKAVHNLASLLNVQPEERQLCTPILYITYLTNLFEQFGWNADSCEKLANTYLDKITTVQVDPLLWAIQTIQTVLLGCNEPLISKKDELSNIYNKVQNSPDDGFDVIFLPEAIHAGLIPDVGPITIENSSHSFEVIDIQQITYVNCTAPVNSVKERSSYEVAFLYSLLNDKGRMIVPTYWQDVFVEDKLLRYFVDNNLIEAMFETEDGVYMLIDKNRPQFKHGRILFYYQKSLEHKTNCYPLKNENLALSLEKYSCEYVNLAHDEGACIVTNNEIRRNDYCLLPKKYIYDFDRITSNAEFQVVRHIAHGLFPKLSTVDSVLNHLTHFIASHELLQAPLQEQSYEGQTLVPVAEAIEMARNNISQMDKLIKVTRKVITEEIPMKEFNSVNLRDFLEAAKKEYANGNIRLDIDCDQNIQYEMHETSFAEMIDNFIRNAELHGFVQKNKRIKFKISIVVTKRKNDSSLIIEIKNNGAPLPEELTVEKFTEFGNKGKSSSGDGLGGAWIYKVIRAHRGDLEIIREDKEYPVNFKITLPHTEGIK